MWKKGLVMLFAASASLAGAQEAGDSVSLSQELNPDTSQWLVAEPIDEAAAEGTAIDVGHLLHAPAGKHGRVQAQGEQLVFADGTPARFWGTNVTASACFPDRATAEHMARQLRRIGCNLVRLHHMDASWIDRNIFGEKPRQTTTRLDEESLARLDYLVHQLRQNGIYIYMDLLVTRRLVEGDGLAWERFGRESWKTEPMFGPELIELQKQYITQLLGHRNPHTGLTYAEDPAIVFTDIINEDSLFYIDQPGGYQVIEGFYSELWQELFNDWLKAKYGSRDSLAEAWRVDDKHGLAPEESPEAGTVAIPANYRNAGFTQPRVLDTHAFIYETQQQYFQEMAEHIRSTGYQGLITGSNHWTKSIADLHVNAKLDWIDRHGYWAHPSDGWRYHQNVRVDGRSMLESDWFGLIGSVNGRRVAGRPFTVSEWNISAPHPWRNEVMLIMPAYAAMQGWHGMQFNYSETDTLEPSLNHVLNVYNQPGMMALWPAMARLYHRQDVAETDRRWFLPITGEQAREPDPQFPDIDGGRYVTNKLSLLAKTGVGFTDLGFDPATNDPDLPSLRAEAGPVFQSVTGELVWDQTQPLFTIDTPRSQGFTGFPTEPVQLQNARFEVQNPFAVMLLTSVDEAPLHEASRVLLTAVARVRPEGMQLERRGKEQIFISQPGDNSRILLEPVEATVTLHSAAPVTVTALDVSGRALQEVPVQQNEDRVTFRIGSEHGAMHYEIRRGND